MVHESNNQNVSPACLAARGMAEAVISTPLHMKYFITVYSKWSLEAKFEFVEKLMDMKTIQDYCPICALTHFGVDLKLCDCERSTVKGIVVAELVFRSEDVQQEVPIKRVKVEEVDVEKLPIIDLPAYGPSEFPLSSKDVRAQEFVYDVGHDRKNDVLVDILSGGVSTGAIPIPFAGDKVVTVFSKLFSEDNRVHMGSDDIHIISPPSGGVLAGLASRFRDCSVSVTQCYYSGHFGPPLHGISSFDVRPYVLNGCSTVCSSDYYFVADKRMEFPDTKVRERARGSVGLMKHYHAASMSGKMLSIFTLRTWAARRGFKEVSYEEDGQVLDYYELGTARARIYKEDYASTFESVVALCRNDLQLFTEYGDEIIRYSHDHMLYAIFLYSLKWLLNSLTVDGGSCSASCGELRMLVDAGRLLLHASHFSDIEMVAHYDIFLSCDTLEDIYYAVLKGAFGLDKALKARSHRLGDVFKTINVDAVLELLGRRPSCDIRCGCFGFMARDYIWNSLKNTRDVPHFLVTSYLGWENTVSCSDLAALLDCKRVDNSGCFTYELPSMYETWSMMVDRYKDYRFISAYYVRLRDYYRIGNYRSKFYRMLVVTKEDVPKCLHQ